MLNETCDGRCNSTANYFLLMELGASPHSYSTRANCYTRKWLLVNERVIRSPPSFSPTAASKKKGLETEQEITQDILVRGWGCAKRHKTSNLVLWGKRPFRLQHTGGQWSPAAQGQAFLGCNLNTTSTEKTSVCIVTYLPHREICLKPHISQMTECDCDKEAVERFERTMRRRDCLWEKSTGDSMINTQIFFPQNTFFCVTEHKPEAFSLAIPMPCKKARVFHTLFVYMDNDQFISVVHFPLPPWTDILAEMKSQTLLMSHENVKMMVKDGTLPRAST